MVVTMMLVGNGQGQRLDNSQKDEVFDLEYYPMNNLLMEVVVYRNGIYRNSTLGYRWFT